MQSPMFIGVLQRLTPVLFCLKRFYCSYRSGVNFALQILDKAIHYQSQFFKHIVLLLNKKYVRKKTEINILKSLINLLCNVNNDNRK